MTPGNRLRQTAGVLAVITLLALIVADTIYPTIDLDPTDKAILLSLISALIGVDIATKRNSLNAIVEGAARGGLEALVDGADQDANGNSNSNGNGNGGSQDDSD